MQQQEIHNFLLSYFQANDCEIVENDQTHLVVQLTNELDKELMNRPFYWHYLEKTGGIPAPMKLTMITDSLNAPADLKGELIHFGSPRLHQIFSSTKKLARFIRLYEETTSGTIQQPLFPWLCLNGKISYQCDRKRDLFFSLGLNLISGTIIEHFHEHVSHIKVTPKIPDYTFTLSPLIRPKSGCSRLQTYIETIVDKEDHKWAEEAIQRWKNDLSLLENFYQDEEDKSESYYTEKAALQAQYEPKISISIVNGGLFYLTKEALQQKNERR
jgi:hypothetical protein